MPIPVSEFGATYRDYSKETSKFRLFSQTITPANQAAQVTNIDSLLDAIAAITLGQEQSRRILLSSTQVSSLLPTSVDAQREKKWLLRYHDVAGRRFSTEIPCADLSLLNTNSDFINTSSSLWVTLTSAWAVAVVSPEDPTRSTVLDSAEYVGRRG
jgi:hypothetical protein